VGTKHRDNLWKRESKENTAALSLCFSYDSKQDIIFFLGGSTSN